MNEYLTMDELAEHVVTWQSATGRERDRIFNKVLESVEKYIRKDIIKKLKKFGDAELENGMQAGRIALFRAMTKWDSVKAVEYKASFLSYLSFWIRPEVHRLINKEMLGPVHVSLEKRFAAWKQQQAMDAGTDDGSDFNPGHIPKFLSAEYSEWADNDDSPDKFLLHNKMSVAAQVENNIEKDQKKEILNLSIALLSKKQGHVLREQLKGRSFVSIGKEIGTSKQAIAIAAAAAMKNVKRIYRELYENTVALNDVKKQLQTHN